MGGDSPTQPDRPLPGRVPAPRVAGYRLEDTVASGALSTVVRARDERSGRTVALKLLPWDPESGGGLAGLTLGRGLARSGTGPPR